MLDGARGDKHNCLPYCHTNSDANHTLWGQEMKVNKRLATTMEIYNHITDCVEFLEEINEGYDTFPELQDDKEVEEQTVCALMDLREMCNYIVELTS